MCRKPSKIQHCGAPCCFSTFLGLFCVYCNNKPAVDVFSELFWIVLLFLYRLQQKSFQKGKGGIQTVFSPLKSTLGCAFGVLSEMTRLFSRKRWNKAHLSGSSCSHLRWSDIRVILKQQEHARTQAHVLFKVAGWNTPACCAERAIGLQISPPPGHETAL